MDNSPDLYQCVAVAIDVRAERLSGDRPVRSSQGTKGDQPAGRAPQRADGHGEDELAGLEADRATLRAHAELVDQPVTYGEASFCGECGEPAPCNVVRRLAERYGC